MPPRRRVRRLDEIALVHVAELVGQRMVEFARLCEPNELRRNVALIKSEICGCVPAAMYDDFAVHVLKTMSRVEEFAGISETFLFKSMASPIMSIIDQLSSVKPYPEVSRQLVILAYMNLHKLKNLRNIEIRFGDILEFETVCRRFYPKSSIFGGQSHWLEKCDLRFLEKLSCPEYLCDKYTFALLENLPRLEVLILHNSLDYHETAMQNFNDFGRISRLRELNVQDFPHQFDSLLEVVLSKNPQLEKLVLSSKLEVFLKSTTIYPALKFLHGQGDVRDTDTLRTVAKRFPNLTSLELYFTTRFDVSVLLDFSQLSSLCVRMHKFPPAQLQVLPREIGHNIVSLYLPYGEPLLQSDVFIIHERCRRCEVLEFSWSPFHDPEPLIVPSFPRLKRFGIAITYRAATATFNQDPNKELPLELSEMPALEYLKYWNFEVSQTKIKSIVLDDKNFPRLTQIVLLSNSPTTDVEHIRRLIKQYNLDLTLTVTNSYA